MRLRAERLDWEQVEGEWKEVPKDAQERTLESAAASPCARASRRRRAAPGASLARVADERGRENETELRVWVAGGRVPPRRDLEQETVTLVPDRKEYRAGDVAQVLVLAPFAPAEGVLTLRRSGLVREERFAIAGGSHTLEIPIEEALHAQRPRPGRPRGPGAPRRAPAASAGAGARAAGVRERRPRPAGPAGVAHARARRDAARDGARRRAARRCSTSSLRDADGPAGGGRRGGGRGRGRGGARAHRLPAPRPARRLLRDARAADVADHRLRAHVLLARPDDLDGADRHAGRGRASRAGARRCRRRAAGVGARAADDAEQGDGRPRPRPPSPIRARTDFAALALFAASVPTDAEGRARVPVKLPDNLTRYRVMAVAVAGARRFGSGEATLAARLPLMVRPSAAALPELRRPLRAAGRGAEPDRRAR